MESQLAFLAICLASAASPGPGGLAVVSNSINHNLRRTLPVIFGIATGLLLASLANTWLLAVIYSSELAFQVMTWLCSGYIAYLGCKALYYAKSEMTIAAQGYGFKNGVLISLLNPKTLVFFGALFPMFIPADEDFVSLRGIVDRRIGTDHLSDSYFGVVGDRQGLTFTSKPSCRD